MGGIPPVTPPRGGMAAGKVLQLWCLVMCGVGAIRRAEANPPRRGAKEERMVGEARQVRGAMVSWEARKTGVQLLNVNNSYDDGEALRGGRRDSGATTANT